MPMCDMYIPKDALDAEAERTLIHAVSQLLARHEVRRIVDLMQDDRVEASTERANSIAWMFVHRAETYVAGRATEAPYYKFEVSIPEGVADDEYRTSIAGDITDAVAEAEGTKAEKAGWLHIAARVWVFTYEVPDGSWGAAAQPMRLRQIVDYVAPGLGEPAEKRWAGVRRDEARALVALAGERPVSA